MKDKIRKRLDRVTQLDSSKFPTISGLCLIDGHERKIAAFEVPDGTKAACLSLALLRQAYIERGYSLDSLTINERENDGMETVKVSMGEL